MIAQFCSADAFTHEAGSLAYFQEDFGMRPHIPSDSVPSSSSSPFSSVSPRGLRDRMHTTPPPAERYMKKLREDGTFGTTSDFPIVLDSDDEDAIIIAVSLHTMSINLIVDIVSNRAGFLTIVFISIGVNLIEPTESGVILILRGTDGGRAISVGDGRVDQSVTDDHFPELNRG